MSKTNTPTSAELNALSFKAGCGGTFFNLAGLKGYALEREALRWARARAHSESIDVFLSSEPILRWPYAKFGKLYLTPLIPNREQAQRICDRMKALCSKS